MEREVTTNDGSDGVSVAAREAGVEGSGPPSSERAGYMGGLATDEEVEVAEPSSDEEPEHLAIQGMLAELGRQGLSRQSRRAQAA